MVIKQVYKNEIFLGELLKPPNLMYFEALNPNTVTVGGAFFQKLFTPFLVRAPKNISNWPHLEKIDQLT